MNVNSFVDFFIGSYQHTPMLDIVIEAIVFVFGVWSVVLAKRQNILVFPVGLIATTLTAYLLYKAGYLAEMTLNVYFSVMGIYGWIVWHRPSGKPELAVSRTTTVQKLTGTALFFLTILVTFAVYALFGKAVGPANYVDIFISGLFFTAMWFMALKKIENWVLYIVADAIAVPLYAHRGLGMLALQYVIFTVLAILAYIEWRKIIHQRQIAS